MKDEKLTRRDFIKGAALTGAGLALGSNLLRKLDASAQDTKIYLPLILKAPGPPPPPTGSRVVHVHDSDATYWDFDSSYYGDYVRQDVVSNMVDQGVMTLTGASTVADAWRALIPNYIPGESIAIKVNLNNAFECDDSDRDIDALIHPINAVIRGLKLAYPSLNYSDIWVYDAIRYIPNRFVNLCQYAGVQFFGQCRQPAGFDYNNPNAQVIFQPPQGVPAPSFNLVTDVIVNATYLINMPILKMHDSAGVSLGFKNHLGTINDPAGLHDHICLGGSHFRSDYNPLVDLYQHPDVASKTILTIGDGLFGCSTGYTNPPSPWTTFGDQAPNSLFFATDPVAIDCVMYDLLAAETTVEAYSDNYLSLAANAGLGTFEHGDPWGSGYSQIDYMKVIL